MCTRIRRNSANVVAARGALLVARQPFVDARCMVTGVCVYGRGLQGTVIQVECHVNMTRKGEGHGTEIHISLNLAGDTKVECGCKRESERRRGGERHRIDAHL